MLSILLPGPAVILPPGPGTPGPSNSATDWAKELSFDCGIDPICAQYEGVARGAGGFLGWLAENMLGAQKITPGSSLWNAAIDEASAWFPIAILVVIATVAIGTSYGMIALKPRRIWMAALGAFLMIPAVYVSLMLGGSLLIIADDLSRAAIDRLGGKDGFAVALHNSLQGGTGNDAGGLVLNILTGGISQAIPTVGMLLVFIVGLFFMSFAIAFRNLGLMILIAFAPLAFMGVGFPQGWQIGRKWAMAGIALLLAQPLMFSVLAMLLKASKGKGLFSPETLTLASGIFVVSLMPMMAYSFFSFLGSGNEQAAGQHIAGQAAQKAQAPGQAMQRFSGKTFSSFGSFGRGVGRSRAASQRGGSGADGSRRNRRPGSPRW